MSKKVIGITVGTPISPAKIKEEIEPEVKNYIDGKLGDIDSALDGILAIQNTLIGGDA
jgi:hypothetical protein